MPDADDLKLLEESAREAGAVAMSFFGAGARRWTKGDDSPVTEADIAVDRLLRERLTTARPGYGWLSEETADDGSRLDFRRVFIIDPIDGTRAFIDGDDNWVVSAAVVEDGLPVAGVLYAPVRDELWSARVGGGARLNAAPIAVADRPDLAGARVAASRKSMDLAGISGLEGELSRTYTKSLAWRLARVADGGFDVALASAHARDWDLAAAILVVQEAGGRVSSLDGGPVRLNRADTRHAPLVAAGPALHAVIMEAAGRRRKHKTESTT